jgi:hypothetical protein
MNEHVLLVIRKILLVRAPVMLAFDYFTNDIGQWWPMPTDSSACRLERRLAGRIYQIEADDREHPWGEITDWQPPLCLRIAWTRDRADHASTEVQIDFLSNGSDRTRIEFAHRGWKPHEMTQYVEYRNYWDTVLVNGYQDYVRRRRL